MERAPVCANPIDRGLSWRTAHALSRHRRADRPCGCAGTLRRRRGAGGAGQGAAERRLPEDQPDLPVRHHRPDRLAAARRPERARARAQRGAGQGCGGVRRRPGELGQGRWRRLRPRRPERRHRRRPRGAGAMRRPSGLAVANAECRLQRACLGDRGRDGVRRSAAGRPGRVGVREHRLARAGRFGTADERRRGRSRMLCRCSPMAPSSSSVPRTLPRARIQPWASAAGSRAMG